MYLLSLMICSFASDYDAFANIHTISYIASIIMIL